MTGEVSEGVMIPVAISPARRPYRVGGASLKTKENGSADALLEGGGASDP